MIRDDEKDIDYLRDLNLWRWECQSKLQETIAHMVRPTTDMNQVDLPILLFILGFPGWLHDPEKESGDAITVAPECSGVLVFSPDVAPQKIKVKIQISQVGGKEEKNVEAGLIADASNGI